MLTNAATATTAKDRVQAGADVGSVPLDEDNHGGGAQPEPAGSLASYEGRHRRPEPHCPVAPSR
jgi:hypothetical protein